MLVDYLNNIIKLNLGITLKIIKKLNVYVGVAKYMELWDIYDKYRKITGQTHIKGTRTGEGEYHLAVRVWIVNNNHELLIQRRQLDNITWAGMWEASASGSAVFGDNSHETAIKETKEEIGLNIEEEVLEPLFTVKFKIGFDDNYLIRREVNIDELILQREEVADVKWASMDQVREMVKQEKFIPFPFLERIFEIINSDISIVKNIPHLNPTDKMFSPINIGDIYSVFYKEDKVGNILIFEKEPGIMKLHFMYITEEFQGCGIEEAIIKRIESLYPEVERWELEIISAEDESDYIFKSMGYDTTGVTGMISDTLHFTNYIKENDIYSIKDTVDLKNK